MPHRAAQKFRLDRCGFRDIYAASFAVEIDTAVNQGENRMIASQAHVLSGVPLGSALPDNYIAGNDSLSSKLFNSQSLAAGVASVLDRSLSFLVSHGILSV